MNRFVLWKTLIFAPLFAAMLVACPSKVTGIDASATPATVPSGGISSLVATVTGTGSFSPGVNWSITSGGGSLSSSTGSSVTYTAPTVTSATTVQIKAAAAGDSSISKALQVSVSASTNSSLSVIPAASTLIAGTAGMSFSATTQNTSDTINWTLSPSSGAGSITPSSGSSTTYTPSASVSSTTTVTLIATIAGTSTTASAVITLMPSTSSLEIDTSIKPSSDTTGDGKGGILPLAASRDEAGVTSTFIANETIIVPKNQSELDGFLARTGGTVIEDNTIPVPPPELGISLSDAERKATTYTVRLDASAFGLTNYNSDATSAGLNGKMKVSSDLAARLMALTVSEIAAGRAVGLNYLSSQDSVMLKTEESPKPAGGFTDAFATSRFQPSGSKSNVVGAWQWMKAKGMVRRVRVAILDGGFWVDANGQPNSVPGIGTDLPPNPIQFDFVNDDNIVGSTNPTQCSGGSSCPWHGNGAVGAALGLVNNQAGAAGTGGLVADPMLFHIITTTGQQKWALETARSWGADVISMSFGGGCNYACRQIEKILGYDKELARVRAAGIVIVAAAGNDGQNVDSEYVHPCNYDGVICVGALADDGNTAYSDSWSSNHGGSVDIWAPTNFPVMPDGANMTVHNFGGTSASSPFIAGIAAMMKAVNPNLNSDQVRDMMRDSAWTDSGDPKVSHYINALEAVKRASNNELPADRFEPSDLGSPAALNTGQYDDLSVHKASESDFYRVTANGASKLTLNFTSPDNLGKLGFGYGLLRDTGCGWQEELENTSSANARKLVYRVPSGVYSLGLGSSQPLPYDMTMTLEGTTILPDGFEPNNTFAAKRYLLDGSVNATLHPGDVDFYQMYSTGSLIPPPGGYGYESQVILRAADSPVTLTLYNSAGNVVSTATTSANCTVLAKLGNLPQGFWTYSVTSNVPGNYNLFAGQKLLRGKPLYDMDSFWRLIMNPSDPVEFIVHDKLEWASLVFNQDGIPNGLDLFTPGLHLALFDDNGLQISTGAATDFQGTLGETLDLSQTQSGARYYLRLERTASTELTESQLPVIKATLKLR
jgi:hypothetical protein